MDKVIHMDKVGLSEKCFPILFAECQLSDVPIFRLCSWVASSANIDRRPKASSYLIVVRLAYSSFGYQVAPRPAGVRSRIVHKGSTSGAPRGSRPGTSPSSALT